MSRQSKRNYDNLDLFKSPTLIPGATPRPLNPGAALTNTSSYTRGRRTNPTVPGNPNPQRVGHSTMNPNENGPYYRQTGDESGLMPGVVPDGIRRTDPNGLPSPRDARPDPSSNYIGDVDIDTNFFSPFQPIWPFGGLNSNYMRNWDYPVGINLQFETSRATLNNFLQWLANSGEGLLRSVIETRKDQLLHIPWRIGLVDEEDDEKADKNKWVQMLKQFFKKPDRMHSFQTWGRMLLDDMFVVDAATVFPRKALNGNPFSCDVVAGQTVRVLIDDYGRIPTGDSPAYQQIIGGGGPQGEGSGGLPMTDWRADELLYAPRNILPNLPIYGLSPVAQIYLRVVESIRRQNYALSFWTAGSLPDLLISCPPEWTPGQIAQYQAFWNAMFSGNTALKSQARFIPGGAEPKSVKGSSGDTFNSEWDERLARIICYAFSVPPNALVKMTNRAQASSLMEEAMQQGLYPLMSWFKCDIMDPLIQNYLGFEDCEFIWQPRPNVDPKEQSETLKNYVLGGIQTPNEARDQLGMDPNPDGDVLLVPAMTSTLSNIIATPVPQPPMAPVDGPPPKGAKGTPANAQDKKKSKPNGKDAKKVIEADFVRIGSSLISTRDLAA